MAGCSYGFDQGNIGGVMTFVSFRKAMGFDNLQPSEVDQREGNIAAMSGIAIGATSMLAPQYLAENSPKTIRGSLTTSYNLMIVLALCLAFWVNYALRGLPADHPYVHQEYMEINAQAEHEQRQYKGYNYIAVFKDIGTNASNRRRFFLAVMLFIFHKGTGTDSLNYFAPEIFAMIGVPRGSSSLLTVGIYGLVKLVATVIYVTLIVDRVGRRLPLMIGATIQACAMLYIGLFIRFANPEAGGGTSAGGYVGIIWIYLYAVGWSFGHCLAPYVVAAEIFPARIRSVCMSFCLFTNWIVNYGITSATPHMMRTMGYGTFLFFSIITFIGVGFVYFCLPELKGRSMESMDDLFSHSLWSMFRRAYPTSDELVRHDVQEQLAREDKNDGTHVSMVEEREAEKRV
ncbi:hypothetical protein ACHAPN_002964 [Verticillium nonalfalfae]